jgi:exodeoxyribonuclease VII large subunit
MGASANLPEYSVSELSGALKRTVEDAFGLVRVRGEISGFKRASSGHVYLALKDADALIDGVMWKGQAARLRFVPEDGLEVIATGRLTTYPGRSKYQIVIEAMEPAGAGALMALLEERRRKLAAEGLFDPARKRKLPFLPNVIGIITSPTGAVIRDMLHRLDDRFPRRVLIWPVAVQGENAAAQIAAAITGFNEFDPAGALPRPDVLIVARGGGSIEDLWAFNEEVVVRAAAASAIPLISAVGHETDTTLIDFAADLRAPTPTAAAEFAVPVRADLMDTISDLDHRLGQAMRRLHKDRVLALDALSRVWPSAERLLDLPRQRLDLATERLPRALSGMVRLGETRLAKSAGRLSPAMLTARLSESSRRIQDLSARLKPAAARMIVDQGQKLTALARLLDSLSYRSALARGFALIRDDQGRPLLDGAEVKDGARVSIEWRDGARAATMGATMGAGTILPAKKPKAPRDPAQPRLID